MTRERIVLAYSGTATASAAIAWLREHRDAEVVALTVDVGQADDLEDVRTRALACGALRAHVVDARDAFARDFVIPALRGGADRLTLRRLPDALVARTLVEIAAVESATAVAHTADTATAFAEAIAAACAARGISLRVIAPAREAGGSLLDHARRHGLPGVAVRPASSLLMRPAVDPARAPQAHARLDIAFTDGVPTSLNGVPMMLQELIESVTLIAGQYGIGHSDPWPMPGVDVLAAACRAAGGGDGTRVVLSPGAFTTTAASASLAHAPVGAGVSDK